MSYKKAAKRILKLLITIYFVYSIYIHLEYRQEISNIQHRNLSNLSTISVTGNNLANRLEKFINFSIKQPQISDLDEQLYDNWRVVNGESRNIDAYTSNITFNHMGEQAVNWSMLQYCLFRVNSFLYNMTDTYLKQQSYETNEEDSVRLEAVVNIYKIIYNEFDKETADLAYILLSIKDSMLLIDDYYEITLQQMYSQ